MKRTICLLIMAVLGTTQLMAQVRISGIYKGETLTVIANRSDAGDIIKSVTYAPLTRLENEVKSLKNQKESLQKDIEKLKKNTKIKELTDSLEIINGLLLNKNNELSIMQKNIDSLATLAANNIAELERSNGNIEQLQKQIKDLQIKLDSRGIVKENNSNFLSVGLTFGNTTLKGNLTNPDYWAKKGSLAWHIQAAYTLYLSENKPFAIKVGLGFGMYGVNGKLSSLYDTIEGLRDFDGDQYDARYWYRNINEKVTLSYLEIPVLLHLGNSYRKQGIQVWGDFGIKLGLNVGASFEGSGLYTSEGHYPAWNVTIRDVEALGFVSDADAYADVAQPNTNKFVVWAMAAAGLRIPIGTKTSIDMAVNCAYTATPVATHDAVENKFMLNTYNLMASETTRLFSLGGNIGLSFCF